MSDVSQRVLILAPGGNGVLAGRVLTQAGIDTQVCPDFTALGRTLEAGAGALLLTAETLTPGRLEALCRLLARQPEGSRLPVIILSDGRKGGRFQPWVAGLLEHLPGAIVLERPVRPATLLGVLHNALAGRQDQCRVQALLAGQAEGIHHRDHFLALLGHELRNPLAAVHNTVDWLRLGAGSPKERQKGLDLIYRQNRHLLHLVNDLLNLTRINRGILELQKSRQDLVPVIQDAVDLLRPEIKRHRHRLKLNLPEQTLEVEGDAERLVQVVSNLLSNAARYTPEGGRIDLTLAREGDEAVIRVKDTGVGIRPEQLSKLFLPFTRLDNPVSQRAGGLGLGLSLAHHLVTLHEGHLEAFSEGNGQGSEFVVRLPALDEVEVLPGPAPPPEDTPSPHARRRVLVVDDNEDVTTSIAMLLRVLGHEVQTLNRGGEVVERVGHWQPQVVLIDIGMPDISGHEVARQLRQAYGDELTLVALSGYGEQRDLEQARQAGFDHHLLKPAGVKEIQAILSQEAN